MNSSSSSDTRFRRIGLAIATGLLMASLVYVLEGALTLLPSGTRVRFLFNAPYTALLLLYLIAGGVFGLLITPFVRRRPGEAQATRVAAGAIALAAGYFVFWHFNEPYFPSIRRTKLLLPDLGALAVVLILLFVLRRLLGRRIAGATIAIVIALALAMPAAQGVYHQSRARSEAAVATSRAAASGPNIVLITIDTLRSRNLGCYGYPRAVTPNIDRLAAEGLLFENAYTPVPQTGPSHATILTGLHPIRHGVLYNGWRLMDHFLSVAEVLKANGYETIGAVSVEHITTPFGFAQGFDHFIDQNPLFDRFYSVGPNSGAHFSLVDMLRNPKLRHHDASWFNPGSHQRKGHLTMDLVENALKERGDGPFFLWLHLFDPHKPYQAPERLTEHFQKTDVTLPETAPQTKGTRERFDLYDAEVAFVDEQMGRLMDALGPVLEETLIVFTADHGESLGEHGETGHSSHVTEEVAKVPLILRMPGRIAEGAVETKRVFTMDIAPTILSFLGLPGLPEADGVDIFGPDAARPLYFQCESPSGFRLYGQLVGDLKAVFTWEAGVDNSDWELPTRELYDIAKDPDETKNLAAQHGEKGYLAVTKAMALDTQAFYLKADVPAQEIDPETKEALEALGYVQ